MEKITDNKEIAIIKQRIDGREAHALRPIKVTRMARFSGGGDSTDMFSKVGMTIQNAIKFVPVEDKQLAIVDNPRCSVARSMIQ